jgi:diguanylate cyclase (GGDEF)-like protein
VPQLEGVPKRPARLYSIWTKPGIGKVLVVEPDPDIARMLEVRLAREGHEVIVTDTGKSAVTMSQEEVIDVALIDKSLTDVGCFELLEQLRKVHKPFECIIMSNDPAPEVMVKALENGAFDLVVKPFSNLKIITTKLKHAVGKVRAERDRDELAHMLAAQTQDLAAREIEAERAGPQTKEEEDEPIDLDTISGTDPLTGLPNRRAAEERFKKEASRALRYDRPLCIALGSIDDLDKVIDKFGHEVADGVLRGIASMFSGMVRDVDFCARRQGGEFFFMFPETAKDSGFIVVERIRLALSQTSFSEFVDAEKGEHAGFKLTASFGVAGLPTDTMNADLLREAAEIALAQAMGPGDKVILYDVSMSRR